MAYTRPIQLNKEEYSFRFSNPKGVLTRCTVISGAGTITLYEIKYLEDKEEKSQVGDSHFLSLDPGHTFYIALNTAKVNSDWEISFRGTGEFELELPDRLLSAGKKGRHSRLPSKIYTKVGQRKV